MDAAIGVALVWPWCGRPAVLAAYRLALVQGESDVYAAVVGPIDNSARWS